MTPKQFRGALAKLEISQTGIADALGVPDRRVRRWIAGDAEIPRSVEILLQLLVSGKISIEDFLH